jgi:acetylornithine deacetylase/succinyl-diaminopimelate desuccinylase-like protein
MQGLPSDLSKAGNVIVKKMKVRCSMRLAPTHNADKVIDMLRQEFVGRQEDDTFGAQVDFEVVDAGEGFCAPDLPPRVKEIVNGSA